MIRENICQRLTDLQDIAYRDFQSALIPTVDKSCFIGVRTPELKRLAKELAMREDIGDFLNDLPHQYFDENQLHALILSGMKDYTACLSAVERFLPYVNNWATCDTLIPKVFSRHEAELLTAVDRWLISDHTYTVRFGVKMLMQYFLDEDFSELYPEKICAIQTDEYYIKMMVAWYFATALAKQYERILPFIQQQRLPVWTHNKAIQKAIESRRITPEHKEILRQLKIR